MSDKQIRFLAACIVSVCMMAMEVVAQTWTHGPSLRTPRALNGAAADDVGRVYAVGGRVRWSAIMGLGTATDLVEIFDGTEWNYGPSLNTRREALQAVFVDGFVYAISGRNVPNTVTWEWFTTTERLDTNNIGAGWQEIPNLSLNVPRSDFAVTVDRYGRIYIIGGMTDNWTPTASMERFDPANPHLGWVSLEPLPEPRSQVSAATDSKGRVYVIGGSFDGGQFSSVLAYDPDQPQLGWVPAASIPAALQPSQHVNAAAGADGRFYVAGGSPAWQGSLSRCIRYDPEIDEWELWTPLPTPLRQSTMTLAADGTLWLVGGHTAPIPSSATYTLQTYPRYQQLPPGKWTVIVHGRTTALGIGVSYEDLSDPNGLHNWMWRLATRIDDINPLIDEIEIHRLDNEAMALFGGDLTRADAHHVLLFDWTDTSDKLLPGSDGFAEAAGDALYALLQKYQVADDVLALIGHSRGSVVVSEATRRMITSGSEPIQVIYVDGEGAPQLYLDSDFDVWSLVGGEPPSIHFDNLYQSNDLVGGYVLDRAWNLELFDVNHNSIATWYLPKFLDFDGTRYVYRSGDDPLPPLLNEARPVGPVETLVNGDFWYLSLAGWVSHGGGGNGNLNVMPEPRLTLNSLFGRAIEHRHSLIYVDPAYSQIRAKVRAHGLAPGGWFFVTWNGVPIYESRVRDLPRNLNADDLVIDIPAFMADSAGVLGFELHTERGIANVEIHDVRFE